MAEAAATEKVIGNSGDTDRPPSRKEAREPAHAAVRRASPKLAPKPAVLDSSDEEPAVRATAQPTQLPKRRVVHPGGTADSSEDDERSAGGKPNAKRVACKAATKKRRIAAAAIVDSSDEEAAEGEAASRKLKKSRAKHQAAPPAAAAASVQPSRAVRPTRPNSSDDDA